MINIDTINIKLNLKKANLIFKGVVQDEGGFLKSLENARIDPASPMGSYLCGRRKGAEKAQKIVRDNINLAQELYPGRS